jgi:nitrogen fixation NifU-like protein
VSRDAQDLYQQALLEHAKSPRHQGPLADATHEATEKNPLCGDRVTLRLRVEDGVIRDASFEARGCMIARAAASLLTDAVRDRTLEDARALATQIDALVTVDASKPEPGPMLDPHGAPLELDVLRGVRAFPARRSCALLPFRALVTALSREA